MGFRFSRSNTVTWVGTAMMIVGGMALFRRGLGAVIDPVEGVEDTTLTQDLQTVPVWVFLVVIAVGLALAIVGGVMQGASQAVHDANFEDYAEGHGWTLFQAPRWVWEARTFPLDGSKQLDAGIAFVGGFRGHWATVLMVDNVGGPQGTESLGTYQIIGLPFNDDMPRVHLMPRDTVEQSREMAGGSRIDFESAEFNAAWRVRGDDARRVHDILHARTLERLQRPDAVGVPIVIDGGAIWTWRAEPVYGEDFETVLGVLHDVATGIPAYLYQDLNVELLQKKSDDLHADWVMSRRASGIPQKDADDALEA
ncbi:hypothetical protein [Demequina sp. NBRC 110052]|uniref:hypothetical protein n=1 Tax=Demequina sp. NBRC 110052 TaxID=1570341 RepID=UPI0009FDF707|nr:hypothetical protein [Demequina sp. NBRC 110052]